MTEIHTSSYWRDTAAPGRGLPRFAPLDRDLHVDVVVVGGGITGITAASLLKAAGRTVALLERDRCAAVDTGHTTAHLTCVTDTRLTDLVETFGKDHARAVWDAGLAAIAHIDEQVRGGDIACGFEWVPGYLHAPLASPAAPERAGGAAANDAASDRAAADESADEIERLRADAALAFELGFDARFVDRVPFVDRPGIRFDGQARFHPLRYLAALLSRLHGDGSIVCEHSEVNQVLEDGGRDAPLSVVSRGRTITCDYVIVATHNPIVGKAGPVSSALMQTRLALYTSYAIGGRVPAGTCPDALFWDTADPYHYLRLERPDAASSGSSGDDGRDYVIFGGADHKTGQTDSTSRRYEQLEATLTRLLPRIEITHRWSGQVIETHDGLPFIGETAPRQFVATGFSGNGMTFGTLGGMMACDAVLDRENPWRDLFDANRTGLKGGTWDYLTENKDYAYYMIRDRFAGTESRSLRAVQRGEGKVLDLDGDRVAAYRDQSGAVIMRSAVCPHMGCIVQWNDAEKTWDCPCHGSRFHRDGKVLAGPAETSLPEVTKRAARAGGSR